MKFFLYSINYSPELTGIGKYNGELAPALQARGIDSTVITANPYYPEWKLHQGYSNRWSKAYVDDVLVQRCPLYVPEKPSTVKRLLHLFSFSLSSAAALVGLLKHRPNVIFMVQPTLFCAPWALLFARLTGAKAVMHIQDFEVDAMFGLGMAGQGKVAKIAHAIESWFLRRFDCVSSISNSMLERAASKGVEKDKLLLFPNWADTDFVTPEVSGDAIREKWGYQPDDKLIVYSGNIGQKQGLEIVLDAAEALANRPNVKFIIIGSGAYREELEALAHTKKLTNIEFKPLQAWEDVPAILATTDIHLVVQKKGAADAVLPSKLTNILSAGGHAVVTADEDTELGKIAGLYPGIYECIEPEDPNVFIKSIESLLCIDTKDPNRVARDYALEKINKDRVIDQFVADMKALSES